MSTETRELVRALVDAAYEWGYAHNSGAFSIKRVNVAEAALLAHVERLETDRRVLLRLYRGGYPIWAISGGPDECQHGRARSVPCLACDRMHADSLVIGGASSAPGGKEKGDG